MKILLIGYFSFVSVAFGQSIDSVSSGLRLSISFLEEQPQISKKYWFFGDRTLPIVVTLTNMTDKDITVEPMSPGATFQFGIKNLEGAYRLVTQIHYNLTLTESYYRIIKAHAAIIDTFNLFSGDVFDTEVDDSFTIAARWYNQKFGDGVDSRMPPVFIGGLKSNELIFESKKD